VTTGERAERVAAKLPPYLRKSKQEIEAERERQKLLAASFTRARSSPAERMLERGVQMESIARANVELMEAERRTGKRKGVATKAMIDEQRAMLAEGLALQGRFKEAAEVHPSKRKAKEFLDTHDAITRPDSMCKCPRDEAADPLTGSELSVSPRRQLKEIYSEKQRGIVALMWCDKCKTLNARPLTGQAAEIAAAHAGSHAVGASVGRDVEVLKA
jgi:hypothetical protein